MKKSTIILLTLLHFACTNTSNETIIENEESVISLSGFYKNTKGGIYSGFEFKGKSTVIVNSLGMEFPSEYVRDENFIRIKTDKSDLLLEMKSENILVGEGFAEGEYIKE